MKENILAKRYAQAFVGYAKEGIGAQKVVEEFRELGKIFDDNREFEDLLKSAGITSAERSGIIENVLKDFSPQVRQFLVFLSGKRRLDLISEIIDYVIDNYAYPDAKKAFVRSRYPISEDLMENIRIHLEDKFKRKLKVIAQQDPGLFGGVQVVVGNIVIDGSLKRRFEDLNEKLMNAKVN